MAVFKCKMCGASLTVNPNDKVVTCEYCDSINTLPKLTTELKMNLYDRADHFRRNNDYDKAMGIYEQILNEDKTDSEAYWSIVLCRYGIEYVEDPATHKRIPTINRMQYSSILVDADYQDALKYADVIQQKVYMDEAKAIDQIQKGINKILQTESPYDVFICYKESDTNNHRTIDSVRASELYYELTKEGFKVFYAAITLEDHLGESYEPYIFSALNSAKVMIVIGSRPEYINATWVKNEWSRFLALMKTDHSKTLIPAYLGMDPYDLPVEFSHLQAQDMSKIGFINDLVRGIKKIVKKDDAPKSVEKSQENHGSPSAKTFLQRAYLFLEDGEFDKASEYFEKVLDIDPKCAEAYLGKYLVSCKFRNKKQLNDLIRISNETNKSNIIYLFPTEVYEKPTVIINDSYFSKAFQYANETFRAELESYLGKQCLNVLTKIGDRQKQITYSDNESMVCDHYKNISEIYQFINDKMLSPTNQNLKAQIIEQYQKAFDTIIDNISTHTNNLIEEITNLDQTNISLEDLVEKHNQLIMFFDIVDGLIKDNKLPNNQENLKIYYQKRDQFVVKSIKGLIAWYNQLDEDVLKKQVLNFEMLEVARDYLARMNQLEKDNETLSQASDYIYKTQERLYNLSIDALNNTNVIAELDNLDLIFKNLAEQEFLDSIDYEKACQEKSCEILYKRALLNFDPDSREVEQYIKEADFTEGDYLQNKMDETALKNYLLEVSQAKEAFLEAKKYQSEKYQPLIKAKIAKIDKIINLINQRIESLNRKIEEELNTLVVKDRMKKAKRKKILLVAISILILFGIISIPVSRYLVKAHQYRLGIQYVEEKNYQLAREAFLKAKNYQDAPTKYQEIQFKGLEIGNVIEVGQMNEGYALLPMDGRWKKKYKEKLSWTVLDVKDGSALILSNTNIAYTELVNYDNLWRRKGSYRYEEYGETLFDDETIFCEWFTDSERKHFIETDFSADFAEGKITCPASVYFFPLSSSEYQLYASQSLLSSALKNIKNPKYFKAIVSEWHEQNATESYGPDFYRGYFGEEAWFVRDIKTDGTVDIISNNGGDIIDSIKPTDYNNPVAGYRPAIWVKID